ncbi:MAG: hypothetical protein ACHBN1_04640 [Heteroscytonema crispum UTEX LB 1556]
MFTVHAFWWKVFGHELRTPECMKICLSYAQWTRLCLALNPHIARRLPNFQCPSSYFMFFMFNNLDVDLKLIFIKINSDFSHAQKEDFTFDT